MRHPVPTEHWEQVQLFAWAAYIPDLALMHAIPNGGKREIRTAIKLKEEGVKPGVPDIFLPTPGEGSMGCTLSSSGKSTARSALISCSGWMR